MAGFGYIAIAILILTLLPVIVLPWEGRKVPDALYAVVGAGGIVMAGVQGGSSAALSAAAIGLISFLTLAAVVTAIRIMMSLQILTGGDIKLLAGGSMWLGLTGTLAMLGIAFGTLFLSAAIQQLKSTTRRPDFSAISALAILCVCVQQMLPHAQQQSTIRAAAPATDRFHDG